MIVYHILLLLFTVVITHAIAPLRKHHSNVQSPMDEGEFLQRQMLNNLSHLYTYDEFTCGEASISCMAFGYASSIPVRCGILKKAPVCKRIDAVTNQVKCDAFCDTDGSGRLCAKAFPECCKRSINGCISSKPRNIMLYSSSSSSRNNRK